MTLDSANDEMKTSSKSQVHELLVVGGGMGGLLVAAEARRRGSSPVVLDGETEPGGVTLARRTDGYLLEPAASSMLLPHPHLTPILESVDAEVVPALPSARRRYVYTRGRLTELRESPAVITAPVASAWGKLRASAEPWIRSPEGGAAEDETLGSFARRRFGNEIGGLLATVAAHGVFAGDPDHLSVRACFPPLPALEDSAGSVVKGGLRRMRARPKGSPRPGVHVVADGMSSLARQIADSLGGGFRRGYRVDSITNDGDTWLVSGRVARDASSGPLSPGSRSSGGVEFSMFEERARTLVVAVAADVAARLVGGDLGRSLSRIRRAPVAIVGLGGPEAGLALPEGFGVLVGPDAGVRVLGVLFESRYAPGRSPTGSALAKAIIGGDADPSAFELDDAELIATAESDLGRILGTPVHADWTSVVRHEPGIPQYGRAHLAWLANLEKATSDTPGLHLAGWSYRGIGISGLATDAVRIADRIGL